MSLTLEFVIGAPEAIRQAVEECDLDKLNDPSIVKGRADLSLHVTPHDLDTLSLVFGSVSGRDPVMLRPHLQVLHDGPECGALVVGSNWIAYAAAVAPEQARTITELWMERMSQEYDDPTIRPNDDAVAAVRELVMLCARAKAESEPLLHLWNL